MMFLFIWIGFEDLDLIGFDSLQVDWIWIWIVSSRDWIDSKKLDWIFGFFQPLFILGDPIPFLITPDFTARHPRIVFWF